MQLQHSLTSFKVLSLCAGGLILCPTAQSQTRYQLNASVWKACEYVLTPESLNQLKEAYKRYNQLSSSIDCLGRSIGPRSWTEENIPEDIRGLMIQQGQLGSQREQLSFKFELKTELKHLEELVFNQYRLM